MSSNEAIAYTDGSCIRNPGPGGWATHVELTDGRVIELGGGELRTTNNRMELRAAIEAVRVTAGEPAVRVITDSSYVRSGITSWLDQWKRRDWLTTTGTPVENQDLWNELDALADDRVRWEWTRAHVGTPGNERCDRLARGFAAGIRRLTGPRPRPRRPAAGAERVPGRPRSNTYPKIGVGEVDPGQARVAGSHGSSIYYLSLVDGLVQRHRSWGECEERVHGVRGARFRRVRGPKEEQEVLAGWGAEAAAST